MDSKKVIAKLIEIVQKQQKVIHKLAQQLPAQQLLPQHIAPVEPNKREAETILHALPATVKPTVANLEVHGGDVKVKFHPGKGSDSAFNAITSTVNNLQQQNALPGRSYKVTEVV